MTTNKQSFFQIKRIDRLRLSNKFNLSMNRHRHFIKNSKGPSSTFVSVHILRVSVLQNPTSTGSSMAIQPVMFVPEFRQRPRVHKRRVHARGLIPLCPGIVDVVIPVFSVVVPLCVMLAPHFFDVSILSCSFLVKNRMTEWRLQKKRLFHQTHSVMQFLTLKLHDRMETSKKPPENVKPPAAVFRFSFPFFKS